MVSQIPGGVPDSCGCYIFKDAEKKPLYVGKAKNLKARLKSYFQKNVSEKIKRLRREAEEVEFIATNNEWEAFLLENNLIKQFRPKFNVLLRDDKTYPFIKINLKKNFPKGEFTRRMIKDGAIYFGPFVPSSYAKKNLKIIQEFFGVATCKDPLDQTRKRPCILFEMGKCLAPCVKGKISKENYRKRVEEAVLFLEGKNEELLKILEERMKESASNQEYETAANYRDLIVAAQSLKLKQSMVIQSSGHIDFFALFGERGTFILESFIVVDGRVVDKKSFLFEEVELEKDELWETTLTQIYSSTDFIPDELCLSSDFSNSGLVSKFLSEKKGTIVKVTAPKSGKKFSLIKTLLKNAELSYKTRLKESAKLEPLREFLNLKKPIKRIECFDVSHFQGEAPYVSMVVWEEGKLLKKEYRTFSLKDAKGGDDYGALKEVLFRRGKRALEEGANLPDIYLIDGGANQAHSALEGLNLCGITDAAVIGLAKKEEKLFLPKAKEPIDFEKDSPLMLLLRKIRDEAHRFAIKTSKSRIEKTRFSSPLLAIEGIGEATAKKLLRQFLTTENVLNADLETLTKAVGKRSAKTILKWKKNELSRGEKK
ncbi:MAG: excinuclease ABC subunit UvrC [Acidobacteria bacterium]|nr:excinuclease ABC subunit UvrC [Acidobacteriota bacterium]